MRTAILLLTCLAAGLSAQALETVPLRTRRQALVHERLLRRVRNTRLAVKWKEEPLERVVRDLRRRLRLNMLVARPLMERAREELVDLEVDRVSAATVLRILAAQHGIVFQNRHGVIFVTTPADALRHALVLELHQVAEILYVPPDFPAPEINISPSGVGAEEAEDEEEESREGLDPEVLLDLIRRGTGPEAWDLEGVSLRISKTTVIVRHTPAMQRKVRRFLARLRGGT